MSYLSRSVIYFSTGLELESHEKKCEFIISIFVKKNNDIRYYDEYISQQAVNKLPRKPLPTSYVCFTFQKVCAIITQFLFFLESY